MMWSLQKPKQKKKNLNGFQPAGKRQIPFDIPEELEKKCHFDRRNNDNEKIFYGIICNRMG